MVRKWIQKAVKSRGALRSYVKRKYGKRGFVKSSKTGRPIIRREILQKLAKKGGSIGKRARLALTLRKLKK
jgi:hypothetical protein